MNTPIILSCLLLSICGATAAPLPKELPFQLPATFDKVIHVTALSDSPTGPFMDTGVPFIVHPTARFACDDHIEWHHGDRYYCLAKDSHGAWTDDPDGSTLLFLSDAEGLKWSLAENSVVIRAGEIHWTDGTSTFCERTADMPKFYMENGIPKALIIAVLPKNSEISFATIILLSTKDDTAQ